MLVTDDAALADRARTMRLHGIGRDAWKRYTAAGSWYYEIEAAGFKDNLTDLAAAIGLVQLERAAELRAARAAIAARYLDGSRGPGARRAPDPPRDRHRRRARLAPVRRPPRRAPVGADDRSTSTCPGVAGLPPALQGHGVHGALARSTLSARPASGRASTSSRSTCTRSTDGWATESGQFPAAEAAYAGAISLPIWPGMTDAQTDRVIHSVVSVLAG